MPRKSETPSRLSSAIEATAKLWLQRCCDLMQEGNFEAHIAHSEINSLSIAQRSGRFYGRFVPLLDKLVVLFTDTYRRYFKLALAHPTECGTDAHEWAWTHLQNGVASVFEWIQDWYVLACDGENRHVRRVASIPFVPGETASVSTPITNSTFFDAASWQAPAWLFLVSPLMGFGPLKTKNVPDMQSEGRLSKAHTRLLLKGMRKVFLLKLADEIETTRNEETAAAGTLVVNLNAEVEPNQKRAAKAQLMGFGPEKNRSFSVYGRSYRKATDCVLSEV